MTDLCRGPIPAHLASIDWYAPHQAWLRDRGLPHHDPGDVVARNADLRGAYRPVADMSGARLTGVNMSAAYLRGAILTEVDLTGAHLRGAVLIDADLTGAVLTGADMTLADLRGADMTGAVLARAVLRGAYLTGAVLPDGRTYEEWRRDAPKDVRSLATIFVALLDGGHLPAPEVTRG